MSVIAEVEVNQPESAQAQDKAARHAAAPAVPAAQTAAR
jgi:membrane fusion protein (multidrug efflux system)